MTLAGVDLTRGEPEGCSTHEDSPGRGQEGPSGKCRLVLLCVLTHRSSPLLCRGTEGRTAWLRQPGRADTSSSSTKGTRDRWLVALQVHGTGLQGRKVVDIEDGEFLIHDTVDRRIQLEPFLFIGRLPCCCNQCISFFVFEP